MGVAGRLSVVPCLLAHRLLLKVGNGEWGNGKRPPTHLRFRLRQGFCGRESYGRRQECRRPSTVAAGTWRGRDIPVAQGCPLTGGATFVSRRAAPLQGARHSCRAGPLLQGAQTFLSRGASPLQEAGHSCRAGLPPYRRRDIAVARGCPLTGGATFVSRGVVLLQGARHSCRAGLPPYRGRDIPVAQGCPLTGGATFLSRGAAPLQGARHCCRAGLPPCRRRDIPVCHPARSEPRSSGDRGSCPDPVALCPDPVALGRSPLSRTAVVRERGRG